MKKEPVFKGIATAIITPLDENGVNYKLLSDFIEFQISRGINALVVCGTTGESSTLTDEEHREVIRFAVEKTAHRVPVIAGTGSNDGDYAVELSRSACEDGADALLLVTPYYNKTTQKGLVRFFSDIADKTTKPIILYNVPSRTGVGFAPKTYRELAEHERIVAIKEAGGNISAIAETMALCGDKLDMYSGNDDQIVPIMSLGGIGAISVLSNIMPAEAVRICDLFFKGDVKGSAALQLELLPLINQLFCEVNPIPVKAAVAKMGFCENYLRLPLVEMDDDHAEVLYGMMRKRGLI